MKRLFLTLALVFGLVATAAAQINIGGRLGATMSTFRGDDSDDAPWGVGFNAGVAAKYGVNQMISIAPELGIDFRRVADDDATFSAWVLQIPVMVRVNVMPQLYLEAGPSLGFILSSDYDYDAPKAEEGVEDVFGEITAKMTGPMFGDTKTFELGLDFGVGYTVIPNLDVNFRVAMGLTDLFEDCDLGPFGTYEVDAQHLQVSLGATYWFM